MKKKTVLIPSGHDRPDRDIRDELIRLGCEVTLLDGRTAAIRFVELGSADLVVVGSCGTEIECRRGLLKQLEIRVIPSSRQEDTGENRGIKTHGR